MEINKELVIKSLQGILEIFENAKQNGNQERIEKERMVMIGFTLATAGLINFPVESYEAMMKDKTIEAEDIARLILAYAESCL